MDFPADVIAELSLIQSKRADDPRFDLFDCLRAEASPEVFLGAMALLRPSLVMHEGEWFLRDTFSHDAYAYWTAHGLPVRGIQCIMNRVELSDVLRDGATDSVALFLAEAIASFWSQAFAALGLVAVASGTSIEDADVTLFRP